jgi:outer membrane protein TolC
MKAALILIVLAGVAHAEPRKPVTLEEALAAAAHAPLANVPAAEVAVAEANARAAGAWPAPSVHVATARLTARVIAGAALPLPIFGTVGAARRHARAEATVVRAQAVVDVRDVQRRVVHAWIELARADAAVVATSITAQHAAELEVIARGRKDAGVGGDLDITIAHAASGRAQIDTMTAGHALDAASADLAGLLGWDPGQPLHAEGGLAIGRAPVLDTLRAKLLAHPEHVLAQDRVLAATGNVSEVRSEGWPRLALEAELQYDDRSVTEGRTAWDRTDAIVGISLELPLFQHLGDKARGARSQETVERIRLAATDSELTAGLYAAYRRGQAASERLAALERDVVPAQERAAALSAQAFREGARDLSYALQAQRDLAAVREEVNTARADAAQAFADLQLAAGLELDDAR